MFGVLHKNEIYNSYMTSVTVVTLQLREGLQMFKSTCYRCRVKEKNVTEEFVEYVTSIIHTDVGGAGAACFARHTRPLEQLAHSPV